MLRRKLRANAGRQHAISDAVRQAVLAQYSAHKSWSVKLHHDNLVALAETTPDLSPVPSYATLRQFMSANGLNKRRRVTLRRIAFFPTVLRNIPELLDASNNTGGAVKRKEETHRMAESNKAFSHFRY